MTKKTSLIYVVLQLSFLSVLTSCGADNSPPVGSSLPKQYIETLKNIGINAETELEYDSFQNSEKEEIALLAARSDINNVKIFGIDKLVELNNSSHASEHIISLALSDPDVLMPLYWKWLHSGDASIIDQVNLELKGYFQDNSNRYSKDEEKKLQELGLLK